MSSKYLINKLAVIFKAVLKRPKIWFYRRLFERHGENIHFDPDSYIIYENISLGNNVFLGYKSIIVAGDSKIKLGNNIMFGPEVMIVGGGHNIEEVGKYMVDVTNKKEGDDRGVIIEDDVWIGGRAILLRGVKVGRGAVVGGGSVVTKNVLPYSVVVGNPAKFLKFRFSIEDILEHENILYDEEKRLTKQYLYKLFEEVYKNEK